jgi:hypothetical protein
MAPHQGHPGSSFRAELRRGSTPSSPPPSSPTRRRRRRRRKRQQENFGSLRRRLHLRRDFGSQVFVSTGRRDDRVPRGHDGRHYRRQADRKSADAPQRPARILTCLIMIYNLIHS